MKAAAARNLDSRTKAMLAAMRRAAKTARITARTTGTKVCYMRAGKIVAESP